MALQKAACILSAKASTILYKLPAPMYSEILLRHMHGLVSVLTMIHPSLTKIIRLSFSFKREASLVNGQF